MTALLDPAQIEERERKRIKQMEHQVGAGSMTWMQRVKVSVRVKRHIMMLPSTYINLTNMMHLIIAKKFSFCFFCLEYIVLNKWDC